MKYQQFNVGERVRVKNKFWEIPDGLVIIVPEMKKSSGKTFTVYRRVSVDKERYAYFLKGAGYYFSDAHLCGVGVKVI